MNARSEFISRLKDMPEEYTKVAIRAFDFIEHNYELNKKETALSTVVEPMQREVALYRDCKTVEGCSKSAIKNRLLLINSLLTATGKPVREITANDVRAFLYGYQEQRNTKDVTLEKYRSQLNAFFKWCEDEEILEKNPMRNIKPIKYTQERRVSLTQYELEIVRNSCVNEAERCLIEMLFSTGCRVSELSNMKISDLDLQQNIVPVLGKGKKVRTVYINAKAKVALADYLKTRKDNCEYLFISDRKVNGMTVVATPKVLQARIAEINKRANIGKHITPHVLRHTTATIALQNGMPLEDIQVMLGHASCSTTLLYADVCDTKVRREHERCVI